MTFFFHEWNRSSSEAASLMTFESLSRTSGPRRRWRACARSQDRRDARAQLLAIVDPEPGVDLAERAEIDERRERKHRRIRGPEEPLLDVLKHATLIQAGERDDLVYGESGGFQERGE